MVFLVCLLTGFGFSVVSHLLWCRARRSTELEIASFLYLTLVYGGVTIFIYMIFNHLNPVQLWSIPLSVSSLAVYGLLVPAYLVIYAGTVIDSPSQKVLRLIQNRDGLTYEELIKQIGGQEFILTRLESLRKFHLIELHGSTYRLLSGGRRLGKMLDLLKFMFGHGPGG